jgi:CheY-like chemotaxis protein
MPKDSPVDSQRADILGPLAIVATNLDRALVELEAGHSGEQVVAALREAREAVERIAVIAGGASRPPHPTHEAAPSAVAAFAGEPESGTLAPMARILIVDDEPALGAALRRNLRGYDVVVTVSGAEALAHLSSGQRFDFILCDLAMPGMGGDDLYREIQRVAPEQIERIVFITGGPTTSSAREFITTVPNPIIEKPFDPRTLREMIRARIGTPTP